MFALVTAHRLDRARSLEDYVVRGASAHWAVGVGDGTFSARLAEPAASWPSARMLVHSVLSLPPGRALPEKVWRGIAADLHIQLHGVAADKLPCVTTTHQWTQCEHMHYVSMLPREASLTLTRDFRTAVEQVRDRWLDWWPPRLPSPATRQRRHRRMRRYNRERYEVSDERLQALGLIGWDLRVIGERHEEISVLAHSDRRRIRAAAARGYRLELIPPASDCVVGVPRAGNAHDRLGLPAWSAHLNGVVCDWYRVVPRQSMSLSMHDERASTRLGLREEIARQGGGPNEIIHRQGLPWSGPGWSVHTPTLQHGNEVFVDLEEGHRALEGSMRLLVKAEGEAVLSPQDGLVLA